MRIDQPRALMIVIALLLSGCAGRTAPARATASPSPVLTATTTAEAVSATRPPSVPVLPTATSTVPASAGAITATPVYTPTPTPPPSPSATPAFAATATPAPTSAGFVRHSSITASTFEDGITVPVGTTVIWKNLEGVSHTVTSVDLSIDSPFISGRERFAYTFAAPGRYELWCRLHQGMTATVVVR